MNNKYGNSVHDTYIIWAVKNKILISFRSC